MHLHCRFISSASVAIAILSSPGLAQTGDQIGFSGNPARSASYGLPEA